MEHFKENNINKDLCKQKVASIIHILKSSDLTLYDILYIQGIITYSLGKALKGEEKYLKEDIQNLYKNQADSLGDWFISTGLMELDFIKSIRLKEKAPKNED